MAPPLNSCEFPSDPPFTIPELRAIIAPGMDNPQELVCEIDGKPVRNPPNYRVRSSVFSITVPDGGLLDPGAYAPCVDDCYYLMLAPLASGSHTLHISAANSDGSFGLDVTYHLTVQRECRRDQDDDGDDDDDRHGDDR